MDTVKEDLARSDVDAEMTVLTPEDITVPSLDASDEVEDLQNSLREAVHDDNVQPKMQCLMMDSSFSMVTMQGEDSGIAWETNPSRSGTPWASEGRNPPMDLSSPVAAQSRSSPAGKIIIVMDEELISRPKKTKERLSSQKRQQEHLVESFENISGRPELMEVSEPNVKNKVGSEKETTEPVVDKEQWLFSLVSEGSEILNIVVPPKLATVDEEESKEMADNLSYLEESHVAKASKETNDSEITSDLFAAARVEPMPSSLPIESHVMDPPGAPVARPPGRGASGNVDYFEAFTLVDAQAPGSPVVIAQEQIGPEAEDTIKSQNSDKKVQDHTTATSLDNDRSDTISLGGIASELLDEVFYGGADNHPLKSLDREVKSGELKVSYLRLPSKPSGSTLFGSQEDILTPIFLPEGPPKIIDPILLEEPKAMAFLYTDLYEDATGSRQKEEDTESISSEKSFHSRHSDREARGYLEKYALIDETPAAEIESGDKVKGPEEGPRTLSQDLYDFFFLSKPDKSEGTNTEEEITDFFRSSANSSPCDMESFSRSLEEDETQSVTKSKAKTNKSVSIKTEKVPEIPEKPQSISSFDFPLEELCWGSADDPPTHLDENNIIGHSDPQTVWRQNLDMQIPVAPPRKKATSSPKSNLDLTPLTPVDMMKQEKEEVGRKEKMEDEKETASPGADDDKGHGDIDTEKMVRSSFEDSTPENEAPQTESVKQSNGFQVRNLEPYAAEEKDSKKDEEARCEIATQQTEPEEEKQADSSAAPPNEPVKDKERCVIL